jgi:hypothetical protein
MSRDVAADAQAVLDYDAGTVWHIAKIEFSSGTTHLSEGYDTDFGGQTYLQSTIRIDSMEWDEKGVQKCKLSMLDYNGSAMSLALNNVITDTPITIWQTRMSHKTIMAANDFTNNITGWIDVSTNPSSISHDAGNGRLFMNVDGTLCNAHYQVFGSAVGTKEHRIEITSSSDSEGDVTMLVGTGAGGSDLATVVISPGQTGSAAVVVPDSSALWVTLQVLSGVVDIYLDDFEVYIPEDQVTTPTMLVTGVLNPIGFTDDEVKLEVVQVDAEATYFPDLYATSEAGFEYLAKDGEVIEWGGERYTLIRET